MSSYGGHDLLLARERLRAAEGRRRAAALDNHVGSSRRDGRRLERRDGDGAAEPARAIAFLGHLRARGDRCSSGGGARGRRLRVCRPAAAACRGCTLGERALTASRRPERALHASRIDGGFACDAATYRYRRRAMVAVRQPRSASSKCECLVGSSPSFFAALISTLRGPAEASGASFAAFGDKKSSPGVWLNELRLLLSCLKPGKNTRSNASSTIQRAPAQV